MKQLQNNFTTPEQSKRLLELGVPADSADCFYDLDANNPSHANKVPWFLDVNYDELTKEFRFRNFLPCWSVGRLIEIYTQCIQKSETQSARIVFNKGWSIDSLLLVIKEDFNLLDFSKLEE